MNTLIVLVERKALFSSEEVLRAILAVIQAVEAGEKVEVRS